MSYGCDYDASRVGTVLGAYIVPIPLILLATGLRLIVKLRKTNGDKIALDDCLMVFATVGDPQIPLTRRISNSLTLIFRFVRWANV